MITDLKPYPAYKDSGVEWLGKVPEAWEVLPLRRWLRVKSGDMLPLSSERPDGFPVFGGNGLRGYAKEANTRGPLILLGRVGANCGCVHRVDGRIWVSEHALRVIPLIDVNLTFLAYVLECADFNRLAIRTAQPLINSSIVRDFPAVLPGRTDQEAIARFLDHIDSRIRQFRVARERLIALLLEEEQAITYSSAIRGLDSSVALKSSGFDWLGDVPAHWKVVPLRRITTSRCDGPFGTGLTSAHYVDQGVRVVRLQNISAGKFIDGDPAFISEEHYATLGDHDVVAGDLLVAGLGDDKKHVGRACVAPKGIEPAMVKADCFRFRLRTEQPEFVAHQLSATARLTVGFAKGSTRQRMNLRTMATRPVVLPPRDEQLAITRYLNDVEDRIGRATGAVERQIVSVREYRTRLISDVVTGKLDVREAATNLPDDPDTDDPALDEQLEEVAAG